MCLGSLPVLDNRQNESQIEMMISISFVNNTGSCILSLQNERKSKTSVFLFQNVKKSKTSHFCFRNPTVAAFPHSTWEWRRSLGGGRRQRKVAIWQTNLISEDFKCTFRWVSTSSTYPGESVSPSLSDLHSVGVFWTLTVRPWTAGHHIFSWSHE